MCQASARYKIKNPPENLTQIYLILQFPINTSSAQQRLKKKIDPVAAIGWRNYDFSGPQLAIWGKDYLGKKSS